MDEPIQFVDLKKQYLSLKPEIDAAIQRVIDTTAFINGPDVSAFENAFARFCETKYCIGTGSGQSALELIFEALELQKGDEVIVPVNSYISTALAPSFVGAKVVFVDCDPASFNIDPKKIEKAITRKTKVIAVTHLYGQAAQMDAIMSIAKKHGLLVVEDAAQAHGARFKGKRVGNFGIACAYSFYPSKNLGCYGDGGAITTNNAVLAKKLRLLRYFGQTKKYIHTIKGHNSKLDTIQAAILNVKLPHVEQWSDRRLELARYYNETLKGLPLKTPAIDPNIKHVFYVYCIVTDKRDRLLQFLKDRNIFGNIHYPIPIHLQKAYRELKHKRGDFPIAEHLASRILSLPLYPELAFEEIDRIVEAIKEFYKDSRGSE